VDVAKPLVAELSTKIVLPGTQGLHVLFYRAALPLSHQTLTFVSGLVRTHRREIGSPWRALNSGQQALLVLVYLRKGEPFAEVGAGFGVSTTTCWRYVNETVELLAGRAPKLRAALRKAKRKGHGLRDHRRHADPDRPDRRRPAVLLRQTQTSRSEPPGHRLTRRDDPVVSGDLPGSTHDTAAARIWNILAALEETGLIALGDKGYHGYDETRERVITPYKGKSKPESQKDANRAHARLRGPGERANAQLKHWRILRKVRVSPRRVGRLAKAIHVLQNYEATTG
jgi:hypothetical protein